MNPTTHEQLAVTQQLTDGLRSHKGGRQYSCDDHPTQTVARWFTHLKVIRERLDASTLLIMAPARVVENWVLSKFLGEGGFGKVWLGYHAKYYCMRVIKEIPLNGKNTDDVKNEVQALRTLHSNPNIVHMVDDFEVRKCPFQLVDGLCTVGGDSLASPQGVVTTVRGVVTAVPA